MNDKESEICAVINAARVGRGLPTLRADTRLAVAARGHSEDMAQHPGMIHTGLSLIHISEPTRPY